MGAERGAESDGGAGESQGGSGERPGQPE